LKAKRKKVEVLSVEQLYIVWTINSDITLHCALSVLLVDCKSATQTVASNKQATTQIVKEARRATTLLNRQGKTIAFQ